MHHEKRFLTYAFLVSSCHPSLLFMADLGPLSKQDMHWVRTSNDHRARMQEIVPRIFLGPYTAVRDVLELRKRGATHIVNLSQCPAHVAQLMGLTILDVHVDDKPLADL
jgi:hypothetical protein